MSVKLEGLFSNQQDFTRKILSRISNNKTQIDIIKEYLLSLHAELSEVLNCCTWKWHKSNFGSEIQLEDMYEELIDVQKFLWGLMEVCKMDLNTFIRVYEQKTKIVEQRWNDFTDRQ